MAAIGAVDVALWDLKGKALGQPLYNLLGGRSRRGVTVYAHATGRDVEQTGDAVAALQAQGYRAIRVQSAVPGLAATYGVPRGGAAYEPAERGLPSEYEWSSERYLRHTPALFEAMRVRFGPDLDLLHDVHHRLSPIEAARLGKALEPFHLFWLEDPTPAESQEAFRLIRQHTTTPIAVGEVFNTVWDVKTLIAEQLIDYVRMPPSHAGGLTALTKIAAFAAMHQVRTGCHGATDLSPITLGAAAHFGLAVPNFGIQEHMPHSVETEAVFPHAYRYQDGMIDPGDAPGHGVEIEESLAAKYPYERAYLPINRKIDGTVWDW
jgi:mannonate dehydratase